MRERSIRRCSSLDDIPKGRTNWKRVRALTDEEISEAIRKDPDVAPILDKEWFRKARIVIPEKTPITIRLDRDIIEWFKKHGKGYQTRINAVLRAYVESRQ